MFGSAGLINEEQPLTLSRKERKNLRKKGVLPPPEQKHGRYNLGNMQLRSISPLTENQRRTFEAYRTGKNLMLHGMAGTGKTYISMYLALNDVINRESYDNITIVRSVVPTRDMGFLPGNQREKSQAYEMPYFPIAQDLFGRGDAYEVLKQKNLVKFITTSFIRGTTINDSVIIVDEVENMTAHELDSVITRVGKNCRIVFCGDYRQSDFIKESERNGLIQFMRILENMDNVFSSIEFSENDIVRSGLVKQYIIAKSRSGLII
jgi:phosphate starvation-inducible PhoH-like protein